MKKFLFQLLVHIFMGVTAFATSTLSSIFTTLLPKLLREDFWPANRGFDSFFGFLIGAQTYFHEVFPDTVPKIETTWSLAFIGVVLVVVTIASWIKTRRDPDAIAHAGRLSATPEEKPGEQA